MFGADTYLKGYNALPSQKRSPLSSESKPASGTFAIYQYYGGKLFLQPTTE